MRIIINNSKKTLTLTGKDIKRAAIHARDRMEGELEIPESSLYEFSQYSNDDFYQPKKIIIHLSSYYMNDAKFWVQILKNA